jgi:hypothetical protein
METILSIWRLLELLGTLGVPLLLGIFAYFRLRKYHDFLAHSVGFLIPPVVFFYLSWVMLSASLQEVQARGGRVCGLAAAMAGLVLLLGTGIQVAFSLIAQLVLHRRHRINHITKQD